MNNESPGAAYHIVCIYSQQNKMEEAYNWLLQAMHSGLADWDSIGKGSDLKSFRESTFHKKLMEIR